MLLSYTEVICNTPTTFVYQYEPRLCTPVTSLTKKSVVSVSIVSIFKISKKLNVGLSPPGAFFEY